MNEQTERLIRDLADRLATPAEHLWGVLVKQAEVQAIQSSIVAGMALLLIAFLFAAGKRLAKLDEDAKPLIWGLLGIWGLLVLGLVVLNSLSTVMTCVANPEYWALTQLLQ